MILQRNGFAQRPAVNRASRRGLSASPLASIAPRHYPQRCRNPLKRLLVSSSEERIGYRLHGCRPDVAARAEQQSAPSASDGDEEADFDLLSNKVAELVAHVDTELKGCSIYLVGMMGSGKSTLGKMLANTLKYKSFDIDTMVELTHEKKPVSEIFKEFGQDYFRDCEGQVLKQLSPYKSCVVATGGGAVLRPMNWSYMQQGIVVWLQGSPELLARRVAKDGLEKRPLLADGAAVSPGADETELYGIALKKVTQLLGERTRFYENADLFISLEGSGVDAEGGAPTAVVMYRLLKGIKAKIEATKEEREAKRNFRIENADSMKTMRTVPSPVTDKQSTKSQQSLQDVNELKRELSQQWQANITRLEASNKQLHSELEHSRLVANAVYEELQLTLSEWDKAAAAADARTLQLLQAAEDEKAALHAQVAQLEQALVQTVRQAAGDRARLSQELEASAAESRRQKELCACVQAEADRMVSATIGLKAEVAVLEQRVVSSEAKLLQQEQEASDLKLQLEEAGQALEAGRRWEEILGQQMLDDELRGSALERQLEAACSEAVALRQQLSEADERQRTLEEQYMMERQALQVWARFADEQHTMAVQLVHALLVTMGLSLPFEFIIVPGVLQLMPTVKTPLLAELVSHLRLVLPLLDRGGSGAVQELLASTAIGCRAVLEGLSKVPSGGNDEEAAAAVGSYAEWVA